MSIGSQAIEKQGSRSKGLRQYHHPQLGNLMPVSLGDRNPTFFFRDYPDFTGSLCLIADIRFFRVPTHCFTERQRSKPLCSADLVY